MRIDTIKKTEEKELKSRKLEIIETMKESSRELEMKILKNEIKALEKIARKK